MAVSKAKKLLGDQLLEKGLITKEQLWDALREQSRTGDKLGEVLIKLSLVSEQVIETLTVTPKESLTNLDPELLKSVPEELVKRHRVIPLRKEGQKLIVAMSNPDNVMALDDLRLMLSLEIEPVYADASEIDAVIQKHYTIPNFEKIFNDFDSVKGQSVTGAMTLDEESIANEAPIVRLVNSLFIQAIEAKASDIHIEPHAMGVRVRFRIDGMLREIKQLRKSIQAAVISRIKIMSEIDIAEKRVPQDGRIQLEFGQRSIDLRVSTLPTIFGEKVVIRVLDRDGLAAYTLDQIGFSDMNLALFREALRSSYGMVLVTGPTARGMKLRQIAIWA
ncbi:Type II secretion system (T2SS), protein E, N-terminal domain [Desulfotomaculum arcticum]|uniref:Type II secretion system (T2SS), protein E, N-terminal domain n=1 Tax=Desulfotruncus arcticus DSM 17038 TaxID=1121424 RepID=A0A1I2ZE90_9FIRM|nr:ATPase, T2SS/T4P/T4SS family [Desulfotruncus arcticus]SFH36192.1 Type II secretion system (T2SS), protein E, N-terminal domain [Desulfotomaculum arcticum] [Desulfotruncus arcticus DSM 17038]